MVLSCVLFRPVHGWTPLVISNTRSEPGGPAPDKWKIMAKKRRRKPSKAKRRSKAAAPSSRQATNQHRKARARATVKQTAAPRQWSPPPETHQTSFKLPATGLWYLAGILAFWSFGYTLMRGSDLWWHLAGGRWIAEQAAIPLTDPYSYTAFGMPWLNDAWLSDLTVWLWSSWFGTYALAWWKWGLIVGAHLLMMRLLHRLCKGDYLGPFLAALAATAIAAPFLDVRPQLYTFFCYVLLLDLSLGRKRPSWWIPAVFLFWVNVHAGVLIGLIALPVALFPYWFSGGPKERRRTVQLLVACFLVCLLNPNHIAVFTRPLRYAFDSSSPYRTLGEWLPPFRPGGIRSWLFPYGIGLFAFSLLVTGGSWRFRRSMPFFSWTGLAMASLTLAMSLKSRRFIPLFALSLALLAGPVLSYLFRWLTRRIHPLILPILALIAGLFLLRPYPIDDYAFHYMTAEDSFPVETMNFIELNGLSGKLFAYYNWGGYIHLRTKGKMKVFIDGRAGTVYPDSIYKEYLQVYGSRPGWLDIVESRGSDYFLWPSQTAPKYVPTLLRTKRWKTLYQDHASVLLVRRDTELPRSLKRTPDSAYKQLSQGIVAYKQRRVATAIQHLEKALEMKPYLRVACEMLARIQGASDKEEEAWKTIDRCQKIYPNKSQIKNFTKYMDSLRAAKQRRKPQKPPAPPGRPGGIPGAPPSPKPSR